MLYDILPPTIFFISLGGIIIILSRVVVRVRREQFSQDVQTRGQAATSYAPDELLNPARGGVELLKSRASVLSNSARQGLSSLQEAWTKRKERKVAVPESVQQEEVLPVETSAISMPTENWRSRLGVFFSNGVEKIKSAGAKFKRRRLESQGDVVVSSDPVEENATQKELPAIKIIRVDNLSSKKGTTRESIQNNRRENIAASIIAEPQSALPAQPEAPKEPRVQGRFIARLTKREKPKSSELELAIDALDAGQYQKAEDILIPYIVDNARDASAYMVLGKIAIARSSWAEAIEIFQQVIRINPSQSDAQAGLGYAALQHGKFTIALQALQRAHEAEPENIKILEHLLQIAQRLDNKILQKSVLEQLSSLKPHDEALAAEYKAVKERDQVRA